MILSSCFCILTTKGHVTCKMCLDFMVRLCFGHLKSMFPRLVYRCLIWPRSNPTWCLRGFGYYIEDDLSKDTIQAEEEYEGRQPERWICLCFLDAQDKSCESSSEVIWVMVPSPTLRSVLETTICLIRNLTLGRNQFSLISILILRSEI